MAKQILQFLLPYLQQWGYPIVLLVTFLETSAFIGLLVPGESVVVIAGLLASQGVLELALVIGAASVGAVLGDSVGYFIGRRFGEAFFLKYGRSLFFRKKYLEDTKRAFNRQGGKIVFLGRFMSWLRAFVPVVAGISRMPYYQFLLFNVTGGIAWAVSFSLIGYFVGNNWGTVQRSLGIFGLAAFVVGAVGLYIYFSRRRKKR